MSSLVGIIRCRVGTEAYCFEMSCVASVHQGINLIPAENPAENGILGWVRSSNKEDIPVFRLADRWQSALGTSSLNTPDSLRRQHIVVINSALGREGYLVDSVSRVLPVSVDQMRPVPMLLNDPDQCLFKSIVLLREDGQSEALSLLLAPDRLHHRAIPLAWQLPSETQLDMEATTPNQTTRHHNPGRMVVFPLAASFEGRELLCGLSTAQVVEIIERLPVTPVPLAPPGIAGFVMWRGQAVPALQLNQSLGLADDTSAERMLIVQHAGQLLALPTSSNLRQRRLPLPHQPCLSLKGLEPAALLGTYQAEAEWLVIPDLSQLTQRRSSRELASQMTV